MLPSSCSIKTVTAWIDDAPLLILLVALAASLFGREAAQGEIVAQLQGRMSPEPASKFLGLLCPLVGCAKLNVEETT